MGGKLEPNCTWGKGREGMRCSVGIVLKLGYQNTGVSAGVSLPIFRGRGSTAAKVESWPC